MEVHHHSHTSRKKWTHYFWEFFMLFLAVFCGFMAENQREHYIEHLREKGYIRSVINDINTDSSRIGFTINDNIHLANALDSLVMAMDTVKSPTNVELDNIYRLFYTWGSTPFIVIYTDKTISQLKSAGGMRLIRKQNSANAISAYYDGVSMCKEQEKVYNYVITRINELSYRFLDKLYQKKVHSDFRLAKQLYENNRAVVREFINWTADLADLVRNYGTLIAGLREYGITVVNNLKKEYRIK